MKQLLKIADVGSSRVSSGQEKCVVGTQGMISYSRMWIIWLVGAVPVETESHSQPTYGSRTENAFCDSTDIVPPTSFMDVML